MEALSKRDCRLGALGAALMLVGDLCLSLIPASPGDQGLFLRQAYLSGGFSPWRLPLLLATGLVGMALGFFTVRALCRQVRPEHRRIRGAMRAGGAIYLVSAGALHLWIGIVVLLAMVGWMAWIRRQYAFGKGGMMERVHQTILSNLDFDGRGELLEVGCGSGALTIRAALTWRTAKVVGLSYWGAMYNYSKAVCEKNARSEGVGSRCAFVRGDANKLDFPDGRFDAVVSNYVYHNIMGADKHALLLESLRVLKKGGVFVLHDNMKPQMYGDMNAFAQKLRDMGFEKVEYVPTAAAIFGSKCRAALMMLGDSAMIVGRK